MSIVGRGREAAELAALCVAAGSGRGAVALLAGEPGIGKSELLAEVARTAGLPVLPGRAVDAEGSPPFWPWRRLLARAEPALGLDPALVDLGEGGEFDPVPAARFRALQRTVAALIEAAEPAGLLVILDDLQWADDASLQLLRQLSHEVAGTRLLVLGAYRDPDPGGPPRRHWPSWPDPPG